MRYYEVIVRDEYMDDQTIKGRILSTDYDEVLDFLKKRKEGGENIGN